MLITITVDLKGGDDREETPCMRSDYNISVIENIACRLKLHDKSDLPQTRRTKILRYADDR